MLKNAGRESRNPVQNHYENLALNLSLTGFKKALNLLTKKLQEPRGGSNWAGMAGECLARIVRLLARHSKKDTIKLIQLQHKEGVSQIIM
jgi:hypothetical protein